MVNPVPLTSRAPACFTGLLLGLALAARGDAATRTVPDPFDSIRAALNASMTGDTVLVAPGTYTGDENKELDFNGENIVLRSEAGAAVTILDAGGVGRHIAMFKGESAATVIDGFTFTHGNPNVSGGAIFIFNASPTVRNCVMTQNLAPDGGGIDVGSGSPVFTNCRITGNFAGTSGGGIVCNGSPRFANCTISGNSTSGPGGGVFLGPGSDAVFTGCVISGNAAASGGGIHADGQALELESDTISGNRATGQGGGVLVSNGDAMIRNSIVWGNCGSPAYAIYAGAGSTIHLACSDVESAVGPGSFPPGIFPNQHDDPLFCAPVDCAQAPTTSANYGLQMSSPLVEDVECGTIGGIGAVCDDVPVEATTWSRIKALRY